HRAPRKRSAGGLESEDVTRENHRPRREHDANHRLHATEEEVEVAEIAAVLSIRIVGSPYRRRAIEDCWRRRRRTITIGCATAGDQKQRNEQEASEGASAVRKGSHVIPPKVVVCTRFRTCFKTAVLRYGESNMHAALRNARLSASAQPS